MNVLVISFSKLPIYINALYVQCNAMSKLCNTYGLCAKEVDCKENKYSNIFEVDVPTSPNPSVKSLRMFKKEYKNILSFIESNKIDCIYFVNKHIWNYLLLRKIKKNIITIHAFHDPIGHNGEKIAKGVYLYNKIITRKIDGAVTFSDKSKKDLIDNFKLKNKVLSVPFIQADWKDFNKLSNIKKKVLLFGRLNSYKGLEFIPDLSKHLYELDKNIKIIIAGKKGDDVSNELIEEISKLVNVDLHNEFIRDNDIEKYFNDSDLCLIPYTSITQSAVITDAYNFSKCVIAFDINGIGEFVNNEIGIIVPKFNVEKMASEIVSLINNYELLAKKSYLSWDFGKKKFSAYNWAVCFNEYIEELKRIKSK